jgi:hypothetical protein
MAPPNSNPDIIKNIRRRHDSPFQSPFPQSGLVPCPRDAGRNKNPSDEVGSFLERNENMDELAV